MNVLWHDDLPHWDGQQSSQHTYSSVMEIPSEDPEDQDTNDILQEKSRAPEQRIGQGKGIEVGVDVQQFGPDDSN